MIIPIILMLAFFLLAVMWIIYRLLHYCDDCVPVNIPPGGTLEIQISFGQQDDPYVLSFRQYLILQYITDHERKPAIARWDELDALSEAGLMRSDRYRETHFGHQCLQLSRLIYSSRMAHLKHPGYNASRTIL